MQPTIINIADFRKNMSLALKEIKGNGNTIILTSRGKPICEIKPCYNSIDTFQDEYYQNLSNSMDFWMDDADDNIFKH